MSSRMEEFRKFVEKYPLLKDEVRNGSRTWQSIYEEWALYGESTDYSKYVDTSQNNQGLNSKVNDNQNDGNNLTMDKFKNIIGYMKKINPDDLNKTLNTVQKVIQIVQTVGGSKTPSIINSVGSNALYNDWWD